MVGACGSRPRKGLHAGNLALQRMPDEFLGWREWVFIFERKNLLGRVGFGIIVHIISAAIIRFGSKRMILA